MDAASRDFITSAASAYFEFGRGLLDDIAIVASSIPPDQRFGGVEVYRSDFGRLVEQGLQVVGDSGSGLPVPKDGGGVHPEGVGVGDGGGEAVPGPTPDEGVA